MPASVFYRASVVVEFSSTMQVWNREYRYIGDDGFSFDAKYGINLVLGFDIWCFVLKLRFWVWVFGILNTIFEILGFGILNFESVILAGFSIFDIWVLLELGIFWTGREYIKRGY